MDPSRWFDGADLGIIPPVPTHQTEDQQPQYLAGCKWTSENWSCPYDAVFMSFWSIYKQSSPHWREDWVECSPDWNGPLGNNFDHLILLARTPLNTDDQAVWFCRYRDRFRDQLSHVDSESFPRWGPATAPVVRILRFTFGRFNGPYVEQDLICSKCGALSRAEIDICFLIGGLQRNLRNSAPSLQVVWEEFLRRYQTKPFYKQARCHCNGQNIVQRLRMPGAPWIWFERGEASPVGPSLTITFSSPPQQLTYSLRAIIYSGGNHFTVRFREESGEWWKHDGQLASGVPQPDNVQSEAELLTNNGRFANAFIYRRDDH